MDVGKRALMHGIVGRTLLAVSFTLLAACSKQDGRSDGDKSPESKELKAPKVKTGKTDLAGKCLENYPIEKNSAGRITACAIKEDIVVGDVTCKQNGRPYLFDDGTLKNCGVKDVLKAGPLECRDGVTFDAQGQIQECFLKKPVEHGNKTCKLRVSFAADGSVKTCE
jgi:hypothetical protein